MTLDHPLVARYLAELRERASELMPTDREEVIQEIRQHIADATAAGTPLDEVLLRLGPADALARAYAVELVMHPPRPRAEPRGSRFLRLAALIMLGGIPTFVVVVTLFAVGLSCTVSGVAVFVAGLVAPLGLPPWIHMDVDPRIAVAVGPVVALFGILALIALVLYVRFAARVVRRVLPAPRLA